MEEDKKPTENKQEKPIEKKVADTPKEKAEEVIKEEKKAEEPKKPKRTEAVVNGKDIPISTKYAVAICKWIRRKNIDEAVEMLEEVLKFKKAVPMKGELAHKKGKGMMSGKYPIKAAKEFIKLLGSLRANALMNELELEKYIIFCKANVASRPYKRFGRARFKRTHITLKLIKPVKETKKHKTHKISSEGNSSSSVPKINITKEKKQGVK